MFKLKKLVKANGNEFHVYRTRLHEFLLANENFYYL